MAQLIQFKRRIGTAGMPAGSALAAGEPALNINAGVADLSVGDGAGNIYDLVSDQRQVELEGAQTITGAKTLGTGGTLTSPITQIHFTGGSNGNFVTTDGAGNLSFAPVPAAGIPGHSTTATYPVGSFITYNGHIYRAHTANGPGAFDADDWDRVLNESDIDGQLLADLHVQAPISGTGLSAGAALGVTPATNVQIANDTAPIDNVYPITSAGLRSQMGEPASELTTTQKTIVPAINELASQVGALTGALRFAGTYDVPGNVVDPVSPPIVAAGALPPASAANEGAYLIVTDGGTGTGNAPGVAMAVGDWLVSTGSPPWVHIPLHHAAVVAANVGITTINAQPWANVQDALAGIYTRFGTAGNAAVLADHVSVLGDGTSTAFTDLTPNVGALRVGRVDGGTF